MFKKDVKKKENKMTNSIDKTTIPDSSSSININNFWQIKCPPYFVEPPYVMSPYHMRSQIWAYNSPPSNSLFPLSNSFPSPLIYHQSGIQNPSQHQTYVLKDILNINRTSGDSQSVPCVSVPYQSSNDNKLQTENLMQMLNITSYSGKPIYPKHHLSKNKKELNTTKKELNTTKMELNTTKKEQNTTNTKLSHISQSLTNPMLCNTFSNTNMPEISRYQDFQVQEHNFQIVKSAMDQTYSELHQSDIANKSQQKQFKMVKQNSNQLLVHTKVKTANVASVSMNQSTTANIKNCEINKSIVQQQHMQHTSTEINRNKQEFRHSSFKTQNSSKLNASTQEKKEYYNMSRSHKDKYENSNPRRMYTLMSPEDFQAGKKSHWSDLEITGSVRNLSPHLWQMTHLTVLYMNDNSLQRLPPEIGRLVNLRILDLSSNKLRSLPAELGDLIYLRELLLNQNFLRVLPYELGKLFQLQVLGLQGNPLSKEVMTLYGNGEPAGTNKLLSYMLDNLQVTANHPPQRPWIPLTRPNRTRPTCIFTVMCYNVLCDKYATRQMYGYCPSWALDWEYRKKGILDEIRHYAADIISLQEVETDQFYNFFLPELKHDGYDGIFSPKSRAKTMAENDRKYVDGCAIFYRTAKFSLIKEHLVEFNQLAMANAEGSDNMLNRVMPKDNIGLAALLRTKEAAWDNGVPSDPAQVQQPILVCTAHIHWDPEFCDVKLIQTMMLSNELRSILDQAGQSFRPGHKPDSSNVQLLLCGDFNSLPDSGVIEFLTSGRVAADHRDFKDLAYKSCLQKISGCDKPNEFTHSFKLASAYSEDIMPYTNYTFEFKGIIDYIFYSKQSMVPLGLLGPLSPEWFKEHKVVGCPHPHVPSDHFPLLVELEMTPTVGTSNGLISRR